jgi:hypothetical protein
MQNSREVGQQVSSTDVRQLDSITAGHPSCRSKQDSRKILKRNSRTDGQ